MTNETSFCVVETDKVGKLAPELQQLLMPDIIAPTVNLNGTGARQLIEGYCAAMEKVREAADALAQIYPHGRDFQTVDKKIHDAAVRQHEHRRRMLARILMELEQIALAVQDQEQVRAVVRRKA